ncbi:GlsB/YeaQ/YmgE family stress response membrane protein [Klenkia brasiliensis]|uniref:GlsB/YeaQ/YmgE family stress response membrane protein n=1 Tax=Klenkia brasiliensis TaxID=333142 RepID=UPI001F60BA28|nr:GlsB/YeaQ/YmgE family stress response membrane protein [Klenkia brasiliensis]
MISRVGETGADGTSRHPWEVPVLWNIIVLLVIGAVAGFIARAVIPGKQNMSVVATIVLGIIGSFVGNLLGSLISGNGFELGTAGWIGSIVGAIIVLGVYVAVTGRRSVRR